MYIIFISLSDLGFYTTVIIEAQLIEIITISPLYIYINIYIYIYIYIYNTQSWLKSLDE